MAYNSDTLLETRLGKINAIYRGTIAPSGAVSATATITAVVVARSVLHNLGVTNAVGAGEARTANARLELTNTTTVTATFGVDPVGAATVGYQVVEYVA